ncbi:MAG: 30S ribosomal protein S8 [bacterium]|nr:30S ribosomal protein S8 [bacterium]
MDSISNIIIGLKNASNAGKATAVFPYSKIACSIMEVLKKEGFISDFSKKGKKVIRAIEVELKYVDGSPAISGVKRISKLSKRIYERSRNIRSIKSGYGSVIISTSKGLKTDKEARKEKIGGESLFGIW